MNLKYLICSLLFLPQIVPAEEVANWSFEFKGGRFESADGQWEVFYGNNRFPAYGLGLGYQLHHYVEVGLEAGYLADEGRGFAPLHGIVTGKVKYRLYPIHLNLTVRGDFTPEQWLVPYLGLGLSRYSYLIETEQQPDVSGSLSGYQYKAGIRLLLDNLDKSSAYNIDRTFGIVNTYFFLEAQRIKVNTNDADLDGTAYLGGIRFEY